MNKQRQSYKNRSVWQRGLFMVLFIFLLGLAKFVILTVVAMQFIALLLSGQCNQNLLHFGKSLSTYQYQILLFLTYNSEFKPFPVNDWPDK